jgi:geranylgeranyl diphosphate synthase type I
MNPNEPPEQLWEMISEINNDFKSDMSYIEEELTCCILNSYPSVLYNASKHLIVTGGKRIRPALTTLSYRAVAMEGNVGYIAPLAIALELIHTATIIHDDIIDKSSMRRGVPTVNEKWGNETALLAGDLIFSKAFGLVGKYEKKEIIDIISNACIRLAEGEMLETEHTGNMNMTEEVYLEVIERKTAALFEACTKCAAILGDGTPEEIDALSRFGYLSGIGFQMTDDILDIVSGETILGKPIGADVTQGRPTFVILHALKVAGEEEKEILKDVITGKKLSKDEVKTALQIINENSIEYAKKRAKSIIEKAKKELRVLKDSSAKKSLEIIADYAISRSF